MAKHKVLKSVAHNIGASFTSLMNYAQDDYVMGKLVTYARSSGETSFFIDFMSSKWSPIFDKRPLERVGSFYTKMFWENVERQGSDRALVKSARLDLAFDITKKKPAAGGLSEESPYKCTVTLIDDRGVDYSRTLSGWWFPEPYQPPAGLRGWLLRLRWRFGV